jgi:LAS superfamily LD-carboxypeptidase LdcB
MPQLEPSVTRRSLRHADPLPADAAAPAVAVRRRDLRTPAPPSIDEALRASLNRVLLEAGRLTAGAGGGSGRHTQGSGAHAVQSRPVRGAHRPAAQRGGRHGPAARRRRPTLPATPALGLLVAVMLVVGSVGYVHADNLARADHAAQVAAASAEQARQDRADANGAARIEGLAMTAAAVRRREALDAATTALAAADAAVTVAGDMVAAETMDPLQQAVAELTQLVAQAPDPVSVAGPDVELLVADAAAAEVVPSPATTTADPAELAGTRTVEAAATTEGAASTEPVATPGASGANDVRLEEGALTPESLTPAEALAALDLGLSARLLAAAEQVDALSAEVTAAADAAAAEIAAAQQAAAEAAAAAEIAAAEIAAASRSRKVQIAASSPNGAIPREALCGVSFASGVLLRCDAAADLDRLNAAYRTAFGRSLVVSDSYRDLQGQVDVKASRGGLAATPGTSNHGRGLAADFDGFGDVGQFDSPAYLWMAEHARDYGWLHPAVMGPGGAGPLEPWHWEYRTE